MFPIFQITKFINKSKKYLKSFKKVLKVLDFNLNNI